MLMKFLGPPLFDRKSVKQIKHNTYNHYIYILKISGNNMPQP